jgi:glucan phosphoethanolaminetransferase (alkaline phosphatase superfamily)
MTAGPKFSTALLVTKLLLLAAGLVLTNHMVLVRLGYFLKYSKFFPLTVFLGIWLLAITALVYVAFTPRRIERYVWTILICLSTVIAESHFLITGSRITIQSLDAMWDPGLISFDMVGFYSPYFLQAFLFTTLLFIGLLIPPHPVRMASYRFNLLLPVLPCLLLGGLIIYVGATASYETRGMPSQFLNLGLFSVIAVRKEKSFEKREVEISLARPPRSKHVVLIVDESISGDFIDLNQDRGTTPFLLSNAASIANFGFATSATNCTFSSNAILRLGADPRRIGQADHNMLDNPTIWKYAHHAGFETNFIDAWQSSDRQQTFMLKNEVVLIDHVSNKSDRSLHQRDGEIARQLIEILRRSNPQFVYISKYGAHFPYHLVYPASEEVFSPAMKAYEAVADRQRLVNTYKNAVRWSVDRFFETLLTSIDLSDTLIIYTSDHGQNLLDDGEPVTHCRRSGETIAEALVPLLAFTQNKELQPVFKRAAAENYNLASHFEIFPTLLNLFGYDPAPVEAIYYQSLFEPVEQPLGFISGPVWGWFGLQPKWHSRDLLNDFER